MNYNLLSKLSNKKRGSGDSIDLNSILSLDIKKKRESNKLKTTKDENKTITTKTTNKENSENKIIDVEDEDKQEEEEEDIIDYSKPIKWNEIKIEKLIHKNFQEIKFIATSIGLFQYGIGKHDLIDKIKNFIQINTQIIENKIKQDNINPFNKNTFDSLVIPIGKDGENELLFWKVFKNKLIFKKIMLYTNYLSISKIQYDHLVSVESMLNNNQINILKEKVKLNKYLAFFSRDNKYSCLQTWHYLFSKIQDDVQFYRNLFKNYKDQIPFTSIDNRFELIIQQLNHANCFSGIQVLIENSSFTPTIDDLWMEFKNCRLELIKLYLSSIPNEKIEKNRFFPRNSIPSYNQDNFLDSMKYLMDLFKNKKILNCILPHIFNLITFKKSETLETLIELIGFFHTFNYWEQFKELSINFKYPWHKKDDSFNNHHCIESFVHQFKNNNIQSIKSNFSKEQLESSVYHPINYQSKQNEMISKLLSIYFITNQPEECYFYEYFLCYGDGGGEHFKVYENFQLKDLLNNIPHNIIYFEKIIFEHASYKTLFNYYSHKEVKKNNSINSPLYKIDFDNENIILFGKCPNRESQIEFIDQLINDIHSDTYSSRDISLYPIFILRLLVRNNDIELINHFISKVGKRLIVPCCFYNQVLNEYSIFRNIKSIEMFEYLFNQLDHFSFSKNMADPIYSKHLEKMMAKDEDKKKNLLQITFSSGVKLTVSFIKYVLEESPSNYDLFDIFSLTPIDFYENHKEYFQCILNEIKKNPSYPIKKLMDHNKIIRKYSIIPLKTHCDFIEEFFPFYFKRFYIESCGQNLINYYFGNFNNDKLYQDDNNDISDHITINELREYSIVIRFLTIRVDIKTLDRILTICDHLYSKGNKNDQSKIKSIISNNILKVAILEQQIFILEYLLSNHSYIFKKKIESNSNNNNFRNGIFTFQELREFVFLSLKFYNIKITNFFFSIITITKKQLQNHSCESTYFYYKDNFK
ncbi:hypothetical protein ACTFIV_007264 [Dictyostelium citrinum]